MDAETAIQIIEDKLGLSITELAESLHVGKRKLYYGSGVSLTLIQKKQVEAYAWKQGKSVSAIMREALTEYFTKREIKI